jgi:hypothetical protein
MEVDKDKGFAKIIKTDKQSILLVAILMLVSSKTE